MKKRFTLPAIALIALLVGLYGASYTYAQNLFDRHTTLIQRLAQRFNLNEGDVTAVFDEVHSEHHAQMQKNFSDRLDQLLADGKITAEQKTAIADKFTELQDLTPEERKDRMQTMHDELEKWAENIGLDLELIMPFGKFHGRGMFKYSM